jgi:two-component system, NarL family, invasion response regulator UvrY
MPKVLVVDDKAIVRSALLTFFHHEAAGYVVEEAANGEQAVTRCQAEAWDVVLLDISMPGMGGAEVLKQMREAHPKVPVIMLSFFLEQDHVRQLFDAGAAGYVAKEDIPDHLIPAIEAVLGGRRFVSPAVAVVLEPPSGQCPPAAWSTQGP